jgi:hypothetical protein
MSQMIKYRNRDKGVGIKLGNPMTESHGWVLIGNKPQYPIWRVNFCLVLVNFVSAYSTKNS